MPTDPLRYVQYADRFGYTPDEVDAIPLELDQWMLPIAGVIDSIRAAKSQQTR